MHKIIPAAAALALAITLPQTALAQNQGHGHGGDHARQDGGGNGGGHDRGHGGEGRSGKNGGGRHDGEARGHGQDRDHAARQAARQVARGSDSRGHDQWERVQHRAEAGRRGHDDRDDRRGRNDREVRVARVLDGRGPVTVFRVQPDRGLIAGCPPGLAKRDNGCLPPGQARRIAQARYDWLWGSRNDDRAYRYDDGYLYRVDRSGSVLGWLPVLGGALAPGAVWPTQYAYQPAPTYYTDYFRLSDPYDYRYANGALYGVDPRTQAITQVAALLTGQPISVGQPMPAGYDVYNVPYAYRSQYADSANSQYRYSDGYVYQVDPTTQLVQAAIQLLA